MRLCYALLFSLFLVGGSAFAQDGPRLIVNEVLADPPVDAPGDANGDGTRDAAQDEFIELANATLQPLDLSGWMVGDDEGIGFTFPDGYTLGPLELVVIFGGGDVSNVPGYNEDPMATRVFQADSSVGNGFSNSGDYIIIKSADGSEDTYIAYNGKTDQGAPETDATAGITFEYSVNIHADGAADQSVVRSPDGNVDVDDPFVLHSTVSEALFSPGVTIDGRSRIPSPFSPRLIVNEFLADPPVDLPGDANGDGIRDAAEDEFVELTNVSREPIDLTGWMVGDDEGIAFTFPDGYTLAPRELLVIFGGGDVSNVPGYNEDPMVTRVFQADSSVGNGLANGGDFIVILSPDGNEDMYVSYNSLVDTGAPETDAVAGVEFEYGVNVHAPAAEDVSVTRSPDASTSTPDPFVKHTDVSSAFFSPGTTTTGAPNVPKPFPPLTIIINEFLADPPVDAPGDANGDGTRDAAQDEYVELANVGDEPVDIGGWQLGDDEGIAFTFPEGYTVQPRDIIAIFGGGDVSNVPGYSEDPLVTRVFQADSSVGNGLANGGDIIILLSDDGEYDTYLAYGSLSGSGGPDPASVPEGTEFEIELDIAAPGNADNSVTRFPDGNVNVIDPFVMHLEVSDNAFSPAETIDGRSKLPPPQPPITIVINEVLANAAGDANGDGATDALEDQFIEIINTSEELGVDLSGWSVGDAGGLTFTFPDGYTLAPQKIAAVFGGGDVSNVPGYNADPLESRVFAASGSLGDGMDASGDYAVLASDDGSYDAYLAFGAAVGGEVPDIGAIEWEFAQDTEADAAQATSITRDPDGDFLAPDPFVQHLSISEHPWSPATTIDGLGGLDEFEDVPHPWGTGYVLRYNWWERDRVEIREAPQLFPLRMDQGTVEGWFRPDSLLTNDTHDPDWTYVISKNYGGNNPGDLGVGFERGEGRLLFFMQDGDNTTNLYQNDNPRTEFHPRWYHFAVTWNTDSMMRMFIDGEKVAETPSSVPLLGGEMPMAIGGGAADLWNERFESFRGMMDEVRISVVERYTESFEKPTEPYEVDQYTLALWHFDEGEGDVTADATGNGFTGYLGGFDLEGNPDPASAPMWIDASTLVNTDVEDAEIPETFTLSQNYPNPFNPSTTINYTIPRASDVNVAVYNVLGQRVSVLVNKQLSAGTYSVDFHADRMASGVYFYVLKADDVHLVRKMILIK